MMNITAKATGNQQYCRICFESTADLIPCYTKLIFRNASQTITNILNLVSQQNVSCLLKFLHGKITAYK